MKHKGFTLLELMVVIAVIAILSSVVIVGVNSVRTRAKDRSVLSKMESVRLIASKCLKSGISGVRLGLGDAPSMNNSICITTSAVAGYPSWPSIAGSGWSEADGTYTGDGRLFWCRVGYTDNDHPEYNVDTGFYVPGTMGGSAQTGSFCYYMKHPSENKWVWCTENGCKTEGF